MVFKKQKKKCYPVNICTADSYNAFTSFTFIILHLLLLIISGNNFSKSFPT